MNRMYVFSFIFTIMPMIFVGCASMPPPGDKEPGQAAEACLNGLGPNITFDEQGHLYTTYKIVGFARYDFKRQLTLSYYSQYPDIDQDYDAAKIFLQYLVLPNRWSWHNKITGFLHSLHSGNQTQVEQRRATLKREIAKSIKSPDQDWLSGLLIHAYGDAYAHTRGTYRSAQEVAYGHWLGHGIPTVLSYVSLSRDPDEIKNPVTEPKYLAYVDELFDVLKGQQDHVQSKAALVKFKTDIWENGCPAGVCPNFNATPNDYPPKPTWVAEFTKCMNRTARRLTPSDIEHAMNLINSD